MDHPALISGVNKLANVGHRAGLSTEGLISILTAGLTVEELLGLLQWQLRSVRINRESGKTDLRMSAPASSHRIRVTAHNGKQIVWLDLTFCPANEVETIVRSFPEYLMQYPLASVLLLTDFTGASFDNGALLAIKEAAIFDKPYIKKTVWLGAASLPDLFRDELSKFSRREFPVFDTIIEALDWLTKD